jgi:hypothetical protein
MAILALVEVAQHITLAIRNDVINPWITAPLIGDTMMTGIMATAIDSTMITAPEIIVDTMVGMIMTTSETLIRPSVEEAAATPGSS